MKIRMTIEFDVEERAKDGDGGTAEELRGFLVHYLTGTEAPIFEDYGPDAWGGYDGAFITAARVTESTVSRA